MAELFKQVRRYSLEIYVGVSWIGEASSVLAGFHDRKSAEFLSYLSAGLGSVLLAYGLFSLLDNIVRRYKVHNHRTIARRLVFSLAAALALCGMGVSCGAFLYNYTEVITPGVLSSIGIVICLAGYYGTVPFGLREIIVVASCGKLSWMIVKFAYEGCRLTSIFYSFVLVGWLYANFLRAGLY